MMLRMILLRRGMEMMIMPRKRKWRMMMLRKIK